MSLYLVQHGLSMPKDLDPERGLSPEGEKQVRRIAQVASGYGVPVRLIQHSGKKRAAQTAEILAEYLKPTQGVEALRGIDPLDDPTALAPFVQAKSNLMLVGHLPFLEKLCTFLVTGNLAPPIFQMQNAGIVCLGSYPETDQTVIKWTLMPRIG